MELDLEQVSIRSLFAESLPIVKEKAAERRILLELEAGDLGDIRVDVRKVKQILYNLLSNAVKFTEDGGRVVLRADRVPGAEVGLTADPTRGRRFAARENEYAEFLRISVSDDGIGISEEDLERLFQPFSQIDSGLARKFEGTGLGLAMVKLLAELHGGTVAMESSEGEGSIFTVWLPMREPGSQTARARPAERASFPLANGSRIIALPGTEKTIRGYAAADLVVIDEAARVEDDLLTAVRPMLAAAVLVTMSRSMALVQQMLIS